MVIPAAVRDEIVAHARAGLPNEACGILAGSGDRVERFYPAEGYHQDYFARNPDAPYCQVVVAPKVAKARQKYFERLKRPGGVR